MNVSVTCYVLHGQNNNVHAELSMARTSRGYQGEIDMYAFVFVSFFRRKILRNLIYSSSIDWSRIHTSSLRNNHIPALKTPFSVDLKRWSLLSSLRMLHHGWATLKLKWAQMSFTIAVWIRLPGCHRPSYTTPVVFSKPSIASLSYWHWLWCQYSTTNDPP